VFYAAHQKILNEDRPTWPTISGKNVDQ